MSNSNPFEAEAVQNYSRKCCVALVLDTSGSMAGEPISKLNQSIQDFLGEIWNDTMDIGQKLEIGVITFDSKVERICEPKFAEFICVPTLSAGGDRRMVDGVREGINMVSQRKNWYKSTGQCYCRPWVIMISSSVPTVDPNNQLTCLAAEILEGMEKKHFNFLSIGAESSSRLVIHELLGSKAANPAILNLAEFLSFIRVLFLPKAIGS